MSDRGKVGLLILHVLLFILVAVIPMALGVWSWTETMSCLLGGVVNFVFLVFYDGFFGAGAH